VWRPVNLWVGRALRIPGQSALSALAFPAKESVHGTVVNSRRKDSVHGPSRGSSDRGVAALERRCFEDQIPRCFWEESKSSNKQFLFRRIAWRLQAKVEGDLSERARRRAAEIASDADLRTRAPKGFLPGDAPSSARWVKDRSQPQRDWRLPAPGSLLTRRLDDRQIVVKVLEEGFEYESRRYRSLSAIAREVTGTRWNGLLFFGLAERLDA
jgi:Protein of unknown function (DUF2924)